MTIESSLAVLLFSVGRSSRLSRLQQVKQCVPILWRGNFAGSLEKAPRVCIARERGEFWRQLVGQLKQPDGISPQRQSQITNRFGSGQVTDLVVFNLRQIRKVHPSSVS